MSYLHVTWYKKGEEKPPNRFETLLSDLIDAKRFQSVTDTVNKYLHEMIWENLTEREKYKVVNGVQQEGFQDAFEDFLQKLFSTIVISRKK